jgi:protein phosphatase
LLRGNKLHQITKDHTFAQKLAEEGALSQEEVEDSRWSHALWNVVGGGSEELSPEVYKAELSMGDAVLLCSDGLTKHVSDGELAGLLDSRLGAEDVCRKLVDAANAAGGSDNTTVVVARFNEAMAPNAAEAEKVLDQVIEETDPCPDTEPLIRKGDAVLLTEESKETADA